MSVVIASGQVVIAGVRYTYPGATIVIGDADPLLPRFDTIVVADDLTGGTLQGTPDEAPFPLSPQSDQVGIAQLFIPAADTAISGGQIVDKRIFVPDPTAATSWTRISATTDLSRTQQGTRTMDSVLAISLQPNTKYRVRGHVVWSQPTGGSSGLQWGIAGPLVPTVVMGTTASWDPAFGGSQATVLPIMGGTLLPASPVPTYNAVMSYPRLGQFSGSGVGTTKFDIIVQNAANAGSFGVSWGQSVASANPIVRLAGSYIEYEVV
jgi:hypothetical protein